ncbi:PhzF family phenazine biosynthesis protein [Agromyces mariniharenae]|uniref:PhzF family phenazine biosynthesis protein n=1 Tax=Agromyces mariniharenae TaxID=2604423 RepID=A0A5S4V7S0_9MICO|nr:PhzF family phenazine biosynthesis protein [Agromyces mariniharenae]TYL54109.1 PhzF family phenazine biosynthesis protein [Agromyces mariniharenae]
MSSEPRVLRYTAFADDPEGGNPAGIVLDASTLDDAAMQAIATEVDYSETAFVTAREGDVRTVRYFSPISEVPFCGHATIATAVAIAEREGPGVVRFATPVGEIVIETRADAGGLYAAFTSPDTEVAHFPEFALDALLELIGVDRVHLDERYPPRIATAGGRHPIIVIADSHVFDDFGFDPGAMRAFIDAQGWPLTIAVLHRVSDAAEGALHFEARNIFPVGRIAEDPATGSAAAAVGGYLRGIGAVRPPARVVIEQGRHVGRPGRLIVDIPEQGGIVVSGRAVAIR